MSTAIRTPAPRAPAPPLEWTSFIGRDAELRDLERMLAEARIITLTGAGGSGKTRLARELMGRVGPEIAASSAWVELASLEDPSLLPGQVALGFGVTEEMGTTRALADLLRPREALIVLDNCEHMVDACAELAHSLLAGCPGIRILATSREALGVRGERAWLVPPLAVPDADAGVAAVEASAAA
jgi:predicted ATPase